MICGHPIRQYLRNQYSLRLAHAAIAVQELRRDERVAHRPVHCLRQGGQKRDSRAAKSLVSMTVVEILQRGRATETAIAIGVLVHAHDPLCLEHPRQSARSAPDGDVIVRDGRQRRSRRALWSRTFGHPGISRRHALSQGT
jgi:hypothetical protein